jgi:hypothetical protein
MNVLITVIVMLAACAILYRLANPPRKEPSIESLRTELRRLTHDSEVADRLVERMRRRYPDASEVVVLRRAIAELRADRRR